MSAAEGWGTEEKEKARPNPTKDQIQTKEQAMAANKKDPTEPIRKMASEFPNVDKGTACTQSSFKANKKGFLYIGMQGGRYKALFKLDKSIPEATKLAAKSPEEYEVGKGGWVTARFTAEKPIPKKTWEKWLTESYTLTGAAKAETKPTAKKTSAKKNTK